MTRFLLILVMLPAFIFHLQANENNPLLEMIGKPYAEYHATYMHTVSHHLHGDSLSRITLVRLFNEAAAADKSGEWDLYRQLVENTVRFYESRKGGYTWSTDYSAEDYSKKMLEIASLAERKGFRLIKVWALHQAIDGYKTFLQNYERAFAYCLEVASELENISTKEFPPRPFIYNQIAALHYTFKEYADAIIYYRKITEDPYIGGNYYKSHYLAMNGLGLCYRNAYEDYNRSDSCFMQILEQTKLYEPDWNVWEGIAKGNIGYNYYLRGDLDTALLWLIPSIEKITRPNDFRFLSLRATNVADIYLKKNALRSAKKYIDIALDYHDKTHAPEKDSHLYDVLSRYYTLIGDKQKSSAYLDSTLISVKKENDAFSGLVLRRVEQQLRSADQKIHEKELSEEKLQSRFYMHIAISVSTALVIILILLGLILFFYRRKRNAYRELVRRSQSWAGISLPEELKIPDEIEENTTTATTVVPEESDKIIMESIENAMSEKKLYKRIDLTLDILAMEIGFNRYYISTALNRSTKKNFNTYINEHRIKEAIYLISEPFFSDKTIEDIAFESGFNDRTTFHRAFKKITGLSPGDFRKNISK